MTRLASFLFLAFGFAACVQTPADAAGQDRILAQGAPQVCTEIYQPVCGTNQSGMRVTYSNACFARAAMASNVTPGECAK
ncbi:MAG TPA: Kazal-type serine protease inhibitor domain-containing protein [Xanthobacteraceae bacterium]